MIIGIDASRANLSHKSGPEWYSYYLIRKLVQLDSENQYILYSNRPLEGGLLDLTRGEYISADDQNHEGSGEGIVVDGRNYQKIKSPHGNVKVKILKWPFRYLWTQGRLSLEMAFHAPDILFIPAHVLPFVHPKRSIITIHDIGYEDAIHSKEEGSFGSSRSKRKKILDFLLKIMTLNKYQANKIDYLKWSTVFAAKHAENIITASNYTKSDIIKKTGCPPEKIRLIPHGYNEQTYRKLSDKKKIDEVLEKFGITRPFFFYIGRIERKKNIPALIEALAILRDKHKEINHKLVLAGDASFGYDEAKYVIREFDLLDDVIMTGWINELDVPYILNAADSFIFPSKYEGFGIPLLQAMAAEVPIAASDITSIPEVAKGAALLFNPRYSLSIADAMYRITVDRDLREKLVSKGKERIKEYSWEKTAKKTLELFS